MKKVFTLIAALVVSFAAFAQTPTEVACEDMSAQYYSEDNDMYFMIYNDDYVFYFDIVCATGQTDIVNGTHYTLNDMVKKYSWGGNEKTQEYIKYKSVDFVRDAAGNIEVNMTDSTDATWHITFTAQVPIVNPKATIALAINDKATCRVIDVAASQGIFQVYGMDSNKQYFLYFAINSQTVAGNYTEADVNKTYTTLYKINGNDTVQIKLNSVPGDIVAAQNNGVTTLTASYVGRDSIKYDIAFTFEAPKATNNVTFDATDLEISDEYLEDYGIMVYTFTNADYGFMAYIATESAYGSFTLDDVYPDGYFYIYGITTQQLVGEVYSTSFKVSKNGTTTSLTGDALFYGDVNYKLNATGDATPIENTENSGLTTLTSKGGFVLVGAEGQDAVVYDMTGRIVSQKSVGSDNDRFEIGVPGVYTVRVNGETRRVVVK